MKKDEFRLDNVEQLSSVWKKIDSYLDARITELREKNDGDLNERDTIIIRAEIAALKELKFLGTPKRPPMNTVT